MKRILLLFLLAACSLTAAAQSERYTQFKEYRDNADTLQMKKLLDAWGDKDPEYYAAWVNYCSVMAEAAEDPTWYEMGVNWAKMGREAYPDNELLLYKQADALFDAEEFQEAIPVLMDIEERGLGEGPTWYKLAVINMARNDAGQARVYLDKMIQEGDDYDISIARELLASLDDTEHLRDSLAIHPDHAAIKAFSQTPAFQELTARFAACDTTLALEEVASVYYGAAYSKDYQFVTMQNDIQKLLDEDKVQEAVETVKARLEEYPVSLYLLFALYNLSEDEAAKMSPLWKIRAILTVIDNTGVSGDPKRPHHVICINDEYRSLKQIYGMQEFKSQATVERLADTPLDRMTFENSFGLEETVYFLLTPPYWDRMNSLFSN